MGANTALAVGSSFSKARLSPWSPIIITGWYAHRAREVSEKKGTVQGGCPHVSDVPLSFSLFFLPLTFFSLTFCAWICHYATDKYSIRMREHSPSHLNMDYQARVPLCRDGIKPHKDPKHHNSQPHAQLGSKLSETGRFGGKGYEK